MKVNMFDIFYANLSQDVVGSEQGGNRPVVVVQNDIGNKYSSTVIVIPITTEMKKVSMPTHYVLRKSHQNGLSSDSMILAEQIRTIDKSRLLDKIGHIDNETDQENILNAYLVNITGKNKKDTSLSKVFNMIYKTIKGGRVEHVA